MIGFEYLSKGVRGLANAHKAGTMAGHLGAAVTAGYFFGEDQSDLPDDVYQGIKGELERIIAGEEAIWFNARQAGITPAELFEPLPEEKATPEAIRTIADALEKNVGETRQSGHNVIFASIAIRALHDHPDHATPRAVAGIRKLTEGFDHAHAGRGYYGEKTGWLTGNQVKLPADDTFPAYRTIQDMVDVTIGELIATAPGRSRASADSGTSSTTPPRLPNWIASATSHWPTRRCQPTTSTFGCGDLCPTLKRNSARSRSPTTILASPFTGKGCSSVTKPG